MRFTYLLIWVILALMDTVRCGACKYWFTLRIDAGGEPSFTVGLLHRAGGLRSISMKTHLAQWSLILLCFSWPALLEADYTSTLWLCRSGAPRRHHHFRSSNPIRAYPYSASGFQFMRPSPFSFFWHST